MKNTSRRAPRLSAYPRRRFRRAVRRAPAIIATKTEGKKRAAILLGGLSFADGAMRSAGVQGPITSKYTGLPRYAAASIRTGVPGAEGNDPCHAARVSAKKG